MSGRLTARLRQEAPALIPYICAGDPDLETTRRTLATLADTGADIIELGVPFSDPIADGPTIQKASERALANPFRLRDIFDLVRRFRGDGYQTPVLLMTYANPAFSLGWDAFCDQAARAGLDGALVTDLPPEEAGAYSRAAADAGLATVFLASPTTAPARLAAIDQAASGFVYYVARAGVTGARAELPQGLAERLAALRGQLSTPLCVGFGISKGAHAAALGPHCDGIVVGSALVRLFEQAEGPALQQRIAAFMAELRAGLDTGLDTGAMPGAGEPVAEATR